MYCKVFAGLIPEAVEKYNEWAKGKWLAKDVIVHTHAAPASPDGKIRPALMIVVFFDEKVHPEWAEKSDWAKAADKVLRGDKDDNKA